MSLGLDFEAEVEKSKGRAPKPPAEERGDRQRRTREAMDPPGARRAPHLRLGGGPTPILSATSPAIPRLPDGGFAPAPLPRARPRAADIDQPSHHDVHQDHQTIAQEGLRAFKRTTVLGYEIPWNNFEFSYGAYVSLEKRHLEKKVAALEKYASQQHRRYANAEYAWNLARVHGINVSREYAEVFQVYRVVA